jgi:hypothetical protein
MYIFYSGGVFNLIAQPSSWMATAYRLSATADSIYLQLLSISGGCFLYTQCEDDTFGGDKVTK